MNEKKKNSSLMQFYSINDMCMCVCISVFVMEDLIKIPIERQDFGKLLQKIGFTKLTAKCGDIWL